MSNDRRYIAFVRTCAMVESQTLKVPNLFIY